MRLKKHPNFFWLNVRAFCSLWLPRLPFLWSKRFWTWTISVYTGTFLTLFVGMQIFSSRDVSTADIALAALTVTIPLQIVGMAAQWWLEYIGVFKKRQRPRGFDVIAVKEIPQSPIGDQSSDL
jgi:hypothetical protein